MVMVIALRWFYFYPSSGLRPPSPARGEGHFISTYYKYRRDGLRKYPNPSLSLHTKTSPIPFSPLREQGILLALMINIAAMAFENTRISSPYTQKHP